ncbi:ARI5A protein, partial [Centropus unirufus]|nr:ARI5A protein [Centropus unirufus]
MSPLAKKKLLAQVSKAESLHGHNPHGHEGQRLASAAGPSPEPPRLPSGPHPSGRRSSEPAGAQDPAPSGGNEVGPRAPEDEGPAPAVFTGCFHACRGPAGCHPLWGHFSSLEEILEPPSTLPSPSTEPERPQDLRSSARQARSGEDGVPVRGCWVTPGPRGKRGRDLESPFHPGVRLRGLCPLGKEAEGRDTGSGAARGHQGLAKPKAVVANPGCAALPDLYKGAKLHFPASFGSPLERLKTQGVPPPAVSPINPFIIPAFPSPLVATSTQPVELCRASGRFPASYGNSVRERLRPAGTWHHRAPSSPGFHRHAEL